MPRTSFVVRYDLRALGVTPGERAELYQRAIQQAAYAEEHGQDAIMLSEHHCSEDGYLPSPIPVAAAMAAVTSTIPIQVAALLVNLHDPIRLAEDIAVLDLLSGGRVAYTIGLGYRRQEYDLFGATWEGRGSEIERRIGLLKQAWTGEDFEYDGRTARVLPTPMSKPHPFLFYGGGSIAAARRAGRLGLGFQPQHGDPALERAYREASQQAGHGDGFVVLAPPGPANTFCSSDPERFWERYGHHLLADATAYAEWHGDNASYVVDASTTVEEMRSSGVYVVLTPEELVERCRSREIQLVTSHPACGGLPAEPSWESLRLVCEQVIPAVRGR